MKQLISFIMLVIALSFNGCKPDLKEIGPSYGAGEGIYGSWELSSVNQVDLKQPIPESRNISAFFNADASRKMQIKFEQANSAYSILQPGALPRTFGTSGTWKFDTLPFPTKLYFFTSNNDTVMTPISNMVRENDTYFGFNVERSDSCGSAYVRYEYTFKRIN
jgi:hypothetical protein